MMALLKCAEVYKDDLVEANGVAFDVKNELNHLFRRFKLFHEKVTSDMPDTARKMWNEQWERDFLVYASIFESMTNMNDQQRSVLEDFTKELEKGEVRVELDEKK